MAHAQITKIQFDVELLTLMWISKKFFVNSQPLDDQLFLCIGSQMFN